MQGEQGIQGIKGEKGDTGEKGLQGVQGIQGEQGFKGDKGDIGEQGLQGVQGEIGLQGVQGIQGEKGDKGDVGDSGVANVEFPLEYISETKTINISSGYSIPENTSISGWNSAYGWGDHSQAGYIKPDINGDINIGSHKFIGDGSQLLNLPASAVTKIEVADSKAEITDTGSNGLFSVTTDNVVRMKINEDFHFGDGNTEWTSGTEYKCFFDKSKGAFRAGSINGSSYWNDSYRGLYSAAFGFSNTASGESSFALGRGSIAGADYAIAMGYVAYARGYNSTAIGLYCNDNSNSQCFVIGIAPVSTQSGMFTLASGYNDNFGDAQIEKVIMSAVTTNNTQTLMSYRGDNIVTKKTNISIPAKTCIGFTARVTAYKSDYSQSADFELKGQIKRDNSGNTTLVWTNNLDPMKVFYRDNPAWDVVASTDTGNLRLNVIGVASTTIKWIADVTLTEVRI